MTTDGEAPPLSLTSRRFARSLRYGENPHQRAALYLDEDAPIGAARARLLQGKPLGYNNLLDADAAFALVAEFDPQESASIAIIKHGIPCGMAARENLVDAYGAAFACDPVSAFGGVVASNRSIDAATAEAITHQFTELAIAPEIEVGALRHFRQKPSLRVLAAGGLPDVAGVACSLRSIIGAVLVQEGDSQGWSAERLRQVSKRAAEARETDDLRFAFLLCKHVKSNAIVIARDATAIGIGGGQVSRVDAVAQAIRKAQATAPAEGDANVLQGSVLASDGFFPFADGVRMAGEAGVRAIIQPGGSKRDAEVIAAADALDMAMFFTGVRQFRH